MSGWRGIYRLIICYDAITLLGQHMALTLSSQVTIQIDTDPPKMEDPTSLGPGFASPSGSTASTAVDVNDLVNRMTKITKEFQIPAELLE